MTEPAERSAADVATTVDVIRRVPTRYRRFTEPAAHTARSYGIPRPLLDALLDHGLPHRAGDGDLLLSRPDLINVALRHALRSPQRVALRLIGKAIGAPPRGSGSVRSLEVRARCPEPGHDGPCDARLTDCVSGKPEVKAVATVQPGLLRVDLALPDRPAGLLRLTPEQEHLIGSLDGLEYHHLPHALSTDLAFLADSGLADCRLANHYLAERATETGVPLRRAFGLLVSQQFATAHCWVELMPSGSGEGWLPVDPFYFTALARWGLLDAALWPANRVAPAIYWKVSELPESLVTHRGEHAAWSLVSR